MQFIRCPVPLLLRLHVLVMEFIGKSGWDASRLKDASLSLYKLRECYAECKLVHGYLSEYNILYFEGHLYIIVVSQAVDLDHSQIQQMILTRGDVIFVEEEIEDLGLCKRPWMM
ncbi:uncharacterized protein LOC127263165 isoform X2 [Andrographis paniculata]|uniref:uncharacterized protein LOC127263165 isoform X2 n=1 Tax=Andrographis paniculata TaxID=175694 RepID=UPI0021E8EBE5|nr:uncharacterized protein LOC127263165 isoform X2 [Andrographis paniculata]